MLKGDWGIARPLEICALLAEHVEWKEIPF